jgi:hypothetical protein
MENTALWISGLGLSLAFTGALASLFFKMGQHSAKLIKLELDAIKLILIDAHAVRIQSLEEWRTHVRNDMHEISDSMTKLTSEVHGVKTLIEERTERRRFERPSQSNWQEKEKM